MGMMMERTMTLGMEIISEVEVEMPRLGELRGMKIEL